MGEWKSFQVGEIGKVITGKTPKTSISDNYGGYIPFLTPSDDMSVKYVRKTAKTLTEKGLSEVKNAILPANSVCVSCIGSDLGKVVITTRPTVTNQQINSIVVDEARFDISFVYYAMRILGKKLNFISKTSTAVPIVNKSSFSSYEIECPSLKKQKQIAAVLSVLDAKIECNRMINDNLQQQAQALFKKWFVDNPDAISWKEGTFSNLIEKTISGDWGKDSPSGNNTQSTGRAAAVSDALLARYDKGMVCTNFCKALKPRAGYSMYVYYYWQYLYDRDIFFSYENGTTGIKNLDINGFIETEPIVIAPEDLVEKFDAVCQTVFSKIYANGMENEQLALVRDTILPKLMSGEIDVSAVQL